MSQQKIIDVQEKVSFSKGLPLSLQHLFAMFGATVLVPVLTGLSPAVALLTSGIGTLIYIILTKGQIPGYLGSSFAFIGPIIAVSKAQGPGAAMFGALISGIVYIIVAAIVAKYGVRWLNRLMPPVVVGSIVIVIGLGLANVAVKMASDDLRVALVTLGIAILAAGFFRGFLGVIPVLVGIVGGYSFAAVMGVVDFTKVWQAPMFQFPHFTTPTISWLGVWTIAPVALVTIAEHVGHLLVTENIVGKNLMEKPGLHRSLLGDGVATAVASLLGGPPATTYGENIGVMAITRVYSVWVIGGAAVFAIIFAFLGKLNALITSIPSSVMGGITILLFGIIASAGLRMLVDSGIDYGSKRNLIISSVIMVVGVGGMTLHIGQLSIESMALATFVGILLNLILPDLQEDKTETVEAN